VNTPLVERALSMKVDRLRVHPDSKVSLEDHDPEATLGLTKDLGLKATEANRKRLSEMHELLWAENQRSILIILQGMDTSGKDGVIRNVMAGVDPQGCKVTAFKRPTDEETDHGYLWRIVKALPAKGDIGIFNRSHYEDVLIARVRNLVPEQVWRSRYDQINTFERLLTDNGTTILKFFLHISKEEQKERLQARLDDPTKAWKFSMQDLEERKLWPAYMEAYEEALSRCSTEHAPWYIIPSDRKWVRNMAVSAIIVEAMDKLDMKWPRLSVDPKTITID
jgi:PPK2 family polyphosphate:nucleotide phosphotransferase